MKETKRVILSLTPKIVEKVEVYKEEKGFSNLQQAIIHMIIESTDVPAYVQIEKEKLATRQEKKPETVEEKILRQEEEALLRKDMKLKAEENKGAKICLSLIGGEVTPDGYCRYPVWRERPGQVVEKNISKVPLESLPPDIAAYQHLSYMTAKSEAARLRVEAAMKLPQNADNPSLK